MTSGAARAPAREVDGRRRVGLFLGLPVAAVSTPASEAVLRHLAGDDDVSRHLGVRQPPLLSDRLGERFRAVLERVDLPTRRLPCTTP